ncbi:transcription initiation factor IIB [Pseudovirgaria hyperparasitica]|uniref:Transcription initiation factor IIB n=1 Tax=Pseudovirgaria hyperparasitica TaxID=470096 RepID=A0A6A6WF33_9PEZI|nr:transcription initiation factor IIB [Pseudovirgaria hyperparasitica]KAF2761432.1 transcription initiation factor IIB [Pseudovirgaria hyperparasitica]
MNLSPGQVAVEAPQAAPLGWQENLNIHLICKECREVPPNLVEEFASGDTVCGSCGLVLTQHLVDTRSEWRTFSNDDQGNDDPSRVGDAANPLLHGSQLQTSIGFGDGSRAARDLNRAQGKSTLDKTNKSLMAAYKQIGTLCDFYHMGSHIADTAKHLYKMTEDARLFKGKSTDAVIAGCIFIACRQNKAPRTFREIYALTKVSKREIGRTFKTLEKFLQVNKNTSNEVTAGGLVVGAAKIHANESTKPEELARRYCNQLRLSDEIGAITHDLCIRTNDQGYIAGRSPLSVAAACIYMVSFLMGKGKTPKDISNVVNVSDGTIRTSYKLLLPHKDALIDPKWIARGGDMKRLPAS